LHRLLADIADGANANPGRVRHLRHGRAQRVRDARMLDAVTDRGEDRERYSRAA
jgi:hypothetical protein